MDDPAFATTVDDITQTILLHASNHDLESLKHLLRTPGSASVQDPETGTTPLHAAIAACGPASPPSSSETQDQQSQTNGSHAGSNEEEKLDIEKAKAIIKELFLSGAIWNDLHSNNETPGCLAWRLGQKELYDMIVEAGVGAELLLNLMDGYEPRADEDDEAEEETVQAGETIVSDSDAVEDAQKDIMDDETEPPKTTDPVPSRADEITSSTYLANPLSFPSVDKILDSSSNGVMMFWEAPIMSRTVSLLCPPPSPASPPPTVGPRVLNIGFGLGLIDTLFSQLDPPPSAHHIIEAHPSILSLLTLPTDSLPENTPPSFKSFGPTWQSSPNNHLHAGKWQDILPYFINPPSTSPNPFLDTNNQPLQFDAIYFDTFAEPYSALKEFFTEYIPGLLAEGGKMSFFMGCGADRRVCYDVYQRVVECDLCDAGLGVEWMEMDVPKGVLSGTEAEVDGEGSKDSAEKGVWSGVRRRYFDVDVYRLPVCEFLG